MQWFSTNIYTSCILNYPFLSELKLYTAETYLPRINFIILTRVWLKIYVSIFLWVVKTSQDFHRTDRTESLPPYPILISTTFGISAENFMLLSTYARFLQFQQLMECTNNARRPNALRTSAIWYFLVYQFSTRSCFCVLHFLLTVCIHYRHIDYI